MALLGTYILGHVQASMRSTCSILTLRSASSGKRRVYVTVRCPSVRPSVRRSVSSIDNSSDVQLVCRRQIINICRRHQSSAEGSLNAVIRGGATQTCLQWAAAMRPLATSTVASCHDVAGTFVAGVSLAFCSRPQRDNVDCTSLLLVNIWVAVFQLISSALFLVGYIWSVVWGFNFIAISSAFYLYVYRLLYRISLEEAGGWKLEAVRLHG